MSGGIQTQVGYTSAPAVAGDFASTNPNRFTVLAGPGGLVAGGQGVTVGRFAWLSQQAVDLDNAATIVNSFGSGAVGGFVHREQQGVITAFLADATMLVPAGYPVVLHSAGDFWVKNDGTTQALVGQKAYANLLTGQASFAATGTPSTVTAATSTIGASTFSVTGSITGNVLAVSGVTSGTVVAGAAITGTGIAANTSIVSQLSGTPGGVGTYSVSVPEQTVASTAVSGTYGTLTVGAAPSGTIVIGALVTGGTTSAGTVVTQLLTGTGGNGSTFAVNNTQTVTSATLTFTSNVETKWIAMSSGAAGELVKISSQALG